MMMPDVSADSTVGDCYHSSVKSGEKKKRSRGRREKTAFIFGSEGRKDFQKKCLASGVYSMMAFGRDKNARPQGLRKLAGNIFNIVRKFVFYEIYLRA